MLALRTSLRRGEPKGGNSSLDLASMSSNNRAAARVGYSKSGRVGISNPGSILTTAAVYSLAKTGRIGCQSTLSTWQSIVSRGWRT